MALLCYGALEIVVVMFGPFIRCGPGPFTGRGKFLGVGEWHDGMYVSGEYGISHPHNGRTDRAAFWDGKRAVGGHTHWRHLANTVERAAINGSTTRGVDAAATQIIGQFVYILVCFYG